MKKKLCSTLGLLSLLVTSVSWRRGVRKHFRGSTEPSCAENQTTSSNQGGMEKVTPREFSESDLDELLDIRDCCLRLAHLHEQIGTARARQEQDKEGFGKEVEALLLPEFDETLEKLVESIKRFSADNPVSLLVPVVKLPKAVAHDLQERLMAA